MSSHSDEQMRMEIFLHDEERLHGGVEVSCGLWHASLLHHPLPAPQQPHNLLIAIANCAPSRGLGEGSERSKMWEDGGGDKVPKEALGLVFQDGVKCFHDVE